MRAYLRAYSAVIVAALLAAIVFLLAPAIIAAVGERLSAAGSVQVLGHAGAFVWALRIALLAVVAVVTLVSHSQAQVAVAEEVLRTEGDGGEMEIYEGFVEDVGVHPAVARSVIEASSQMSDADRSLDFHRANIPNFAAELGYRLGIDPKTREAMREFFLTNQDKDTRRSFSTSMRLVMEEGRIEQTQDTNAEVEPIVSPDAERFPEKELVDAPMIFDAWDGLVDEDERTERDDCFRTQDDSSVLDLHDSVLDKEDIGSTESDDGWLNETVSPENASDLAGIAEYHDDEIDEDDAEYHDAVEDRDEDRSEADSFYALGQEILEPADELPTENLSEDEIFEQVTSDPNISALAQGILMTRRLPKMDDLRYLYSIYGSEHPSLIVEFRAPSITHKEQMGDAVRPLFNHAGVWRHRSSVWVCDLGDRPAQEDDLSAVIWIPVGVTHLGDPADRVAWKLVPVSSGGTETFYVAATEMPLVSARIEWILGNVYEDMEILDDGDPKTFFIPSLQTTIDLKTSEAATHGDHDIFGDETEPRGPEAPALCGLSIFSDGGRALFSSRLGIEEISHPDWLAVFSLTAVLCMRTEPVDSKELLGQWATPDSPRGKQLISMLQSIYGDSLVGDSKGWVLANVRVDLFWLDDILTRGGNESIVRRYFLKDFEVDALEWILNLSSMDPRTRTVDLVQMEQLLRSTLSQTVEILRVGAEPELVEKLDAISSLIGKDDS